MSKITDIQTILGVVPDGIFGPKSQAALDAAKAEASKTGDVNHVMASSFADPADIRGYRRCREKGGTRLECFKEGDNGIGCWGDDTTADVPMCALPPDDFLDEFGKDARGKKVKVTIGDKSVVCELRDRMPWKKNIRNGAGIDLNPAAVEALGQKIPLMKAATWEWA